MAKKTAAQKLWAVHRKKVQVQRYESLLLLTSEAVHKYLVEHPMIGFDVPDEIYVPWVAAMKNLGGNV